MDHERRHPRSARSLACGAPCRGGGTQATGTHPSVTGSRTHRRYAAIAGNTTLHTRLSHASAHGYTRTPAPSAA